MPRTYKPKTNRKNARTKPLSLPAQFRAGFLAELDKRTELSRFLRASYSNVVADIGGPEDLSHVKAALVERFVWLEAILQTLEHEMANGALDKAEALGKWIQAVNSLSGLAKVLGIERKASRMPWLTLPLPTADSNSTEPAPATASNGANP